MDYFPFFYKIKSQKCLVVGAGDIAARKIELLAMAGANITVIAKKIGQPIAKMPHSANLTIKQADIRGENLDTYQLIVSATDDFEINQYVANTASQLGIPVNVVDNPELSSFIFPAVVDRSPIIIAVSSGGASPVMTRLLRAKIETFIPSSYGKLAVLAETFRDKVKQTIRNTQQRRIFWENIFQGTVAELVFAGKQKTAEQALQKALNTYSLTSNKGEVYLIGAGPGAADLLTFRALRLLQQADVVVYDRLVSPEIISMARRDSEKIYVGKQRQNHTLPQVSINQLLADLAISGKRVARLKGGDPFIFGRGGEEIQTLMEQGIHFQVVPGITAASGCASYAGIPLTHRDHAQSCVFVTGHLKHDIVNLNWMQLALPNQTVVIYMGLLGLEQVCTSLITHGSPKTLPIALIQQGTTENQKILLGTLESMPSLVKTREIKAPTIIIIGTVVTLHNQLNWFGE